MRGRTIAVSVVLGVAAIWAVVVKARRDSADPARCVGLVPMGNRCCAPGQRVDGGVCAGRPTACPAPLIIADRGCVAVQSRASLSGGVLHAGAGDWEAEGRVAPHDALVGPFEIDRTEVTETTYSECVRQGRCATVPLSGEPGRPICGVTRAEAEAVCGFLLGRLPTNDEWTWAAGGGRGRRYPWGDTGAVCRRGVWGIVSGPCGFGSDGPEVSGVHGDGATPEGIMDLAGNVAEWVSDGTETTGFVRGGSWASGLATELRTWLVRAALPSIRSREIGVRCAYSPSAGSVVTSTTP
jgi:formylglycine-generating enzyme required for sulfatase activity